MVTLEDLLEELVGPIDDEHDIPSPADPVRELGGSRFEVDATATLDEVNERLGIQLPTDGEFQTIGGLVFQELGRLPMKGDRVIAHGVAFTVADVSDHTIRRLVIDLAPEISTVETAQSAQESRNGWACRPTGSRNGVIDRRRRVRRSARQTKLSLGLAHSRGFRDEPGGDAVHPGAGKGRRTGQGCTSAQVAVAGWT